MDRTIKGRTLQEAFSLLRAPYTGKWKYKKNIPFIPIEGFSERMDQVFGPDNIWIEFTEPKLICLSTTGQEVFVNMCHLTIFDDSGNIYRKTDGIGATEILPSQTSGKQSGLGNSPASTATLAYKDACKRLGIFGETLEDESGSKNNTVDKASQKDTEKRIVSFTIMTAFTEKTSNKGSSWRCPVTVKEKNGTKTEGTLVVFNNVYNSDEKVKRLIATASDNPKYTVTAEVTVNTTYDKDKVNYILKKIL
ncbi:MAG: hypothetical protein IJN92_10180 [Lachnospiraceae bacterium]|nr:hypothetical protein [Lachnospiraceae bacterium]